MVPIAIDLRTTRSVSNTPESMYESPGLANPGSIPRRSCEKVNDIPSSTIITVLVAMADFY